VAYGIIIKQSIRIDFIIIHESAHEWWGNSLSCSDRRYVVHEAFATYAEALYKNAPGL